MWSLVKKCWCWWRRNNSLAWGCNCYFIVNNGREGCTFKIKSIFHWLSSKYCLLWIQQRIGMKWNSRIKGDNIWTKCILTILDLQRFCDFGHHLAMCISSIQHLFFQNVIFTGEHNHVNKTFRNCVENEFLRDEPLEVLFIMFCCFVTGVHLSHSQRWWGLKYYNFQENSEAQEKTDAWDRHDIGSRSVGDALQILLVFIYNIKYKILSSKYFLALEVQKLVCVCNCILVTNLKFEFFFYEQPCIKRI